MVHIYAHESRYLPRPEVRDIPEAWVSELPNVGTGNQTTVLGKNRTKHVQSTGESSLRSTKTILGMGVWLKLFPTGAGDLIGYSYVKATAVNMILSGSFSLNNFNTHTWKLVKCRHCEDHFVELLSVESATAQLSVWGSIIITCQKYEKQ